MDSVIRANPRWLLTCSMLRGNGKKGQKKRLTQLTAHRVPMVWLIGPSTHPTDLGSHLQEHGWMLEDTAPGMAVDLRSLDEHLPLQSKESNS
ncbi:MAG: hypothetical protein E6I91_10215 [Chloroflexi bacterium]|nr:MAG: hypothetical protein E6I91_10215 [Chloroflexota bacterium]